MTNEEMQKAMEFIAEQEARSSAKIVALTEAQNQGGCGRRRVSVLAKVSKRADCNRGDPYD
jgi:hypothetical protein